MKYNAVSGDLTGEVTSVDVPVYFFLGRHDYTTPFELAEEYFHKLAAPRKELVWFENSAHFAFYESRDDSPRDAHCGF
jgi:pimeloyl-ACP methyl ester carboxylesterase